MILNWNIPGILSDSDELEIDLGAAAITITSLTPQCLTAPSSTSMVMRVQDETGASPTNYIQASVAAGATIGTTVTGDVPIVALGSVFIRIVTASSAQWLQSVSTYATGGTATGSTLATLAALKAARSITDSSEDALLTTVLQATSASILNCIGRDILATTHTDEVHYGDGSEFILLKDSPVTTLTGIDQASTALTTDDYEQDATTGIVRKIGGVWSRGVKFEVTYDSGYATVPVDLARACVMQAGYSYLNATDGGDRLGNSGPVNAEAGTPGFLTGAWEPEAWDIIQRYRSLHG